MTLLPGRVRMRITTLSQLISKLQTEGAECIVAEHGNGTLVQTGRFGYWFDKEGKLNGGWVQKCSKDWQAEWREWSGWLEWTLEFSRAGPQH